MKYLSKALMNYKKETFLAPLLKMLEALLDLFVPIVTAEIINRGIAQGDKSYVLTRTLLLIGLGLLGLAMSITAQYFSAKAAVGVSTNLRSELFAHIQSLGYAELDKAGQSTLITRMTSDINQVQNGINLFLRLFLRSPFIVFGAMIMAFTIDPHTAMIFVIVIPVLAAVVFGIMKITRPLYRNVQNQLDDLTGITRENLTGVRVVRAFGREKNETERFRTGNDLLIRMQVNVGRISTLMNPLTFVIINVAIIAVLNTGAVRLNVGILNQGEVIALVNYLNQILIELVKLANLIVQVSRSLACMDRVSSVLAIEPAMTYPQSTPHKRPALSQPAVAFSHVELTYPEAGAPSLTDIDFQAMPGQTIGIIGGTGSGKSSLVNLIPRFYDATKGEITLFGVPVKDYDEQSLRSMIAVVPQKAQLFSGTIRSNLLMGNPDASEEDLNEALACAQALEVVQGKENGLDEVVEQGGRNFSGGQRQRLTIARALVKKPQILILDDSASALDYATDAALRRAIRSLSGSLTVFIVSQRANSVQLSDTILVLDDGRLTGKGTHDQLLQSCEVYKDIYDSQFRKAGEA